MRKAILKITIGLIIGIISFILIDLYNAKNLNDSKAFYWLLVVGMIFGLIYFLYGIYLLIISLLKK